MGTDDTYAPATILATTDGGASWTVQYSKKRPGHYQSNLVSVAVVDAKHVWAVGAGSLILATSNGGLTWQRQTSGTAAWFGSVVFCDAQHGWAVGETDDGNGNFISSTMLGTTNGGATWIERR